MKRPILSAHRRQFLSALALGSAGLFAPGVDFKNTTPEDIARTVLPHTTYLLRREPAPPKRLSTKLKLRRRAPT